MIVSLGGDGFEIRPTTEPARRALHRCVESLARRRSRPHRTLPVRLWTKVQTLPLARQHPRVSPRYSEPDSDATSDRSPDSNRTSMTNRSSSGYSRRLRSMNASINASATAGSGTLVRSSGIGTHRHRRSHRDQGARRASEGSRHRPAVAGDPLQAAAHVTQVAPRAWGCAQRRASSPAPSTASGCRSAKRRRRFR